jgi:hypothetical protein
MLSNVSDGVGLFRKHSESFGRVDPNSRNRCHQMRRLADSVSALAMTSPRQINAAMAMRRRLRQVAVVHVGNSAVFTGNCLVPW